MLVSQTERSTLKIEERYWCKGLRHVAGTDEAGRGPLAGPVVAAAVIFDREVYLEGVTDSKRLSERQRRLIWPLIKSKALTYGIGIVDESEIDRINILNASLKAMRIAVDSLSLNPEVILVDGNRPPYPRTHSVPQECIVKGDLKSFTIAAASILAKVTRDRIMFAYHRKNGQYNFAQNKGYPTPEHLQCIRDHGLSPVHRSSFCRRILAEMHAGVQLEIDL